MYNLSPNKTVKMTSKSKRITESDLGEAIRLLESTKDSPCETGLKISKSLLKALKLKQ